MTRTPALPVMLTLAGAYLAWFGVHYWRTDVQWPSDPVKAVLTGKPLPVGTKTAGLTTPVDTPAVLGAASQAATASAGAGTLDKAQIVALWTANGGSVATADVASAVAMAESSGRAGVTSANPDGGTNVGLWQLDTRGIGSGYSITALQDPATNARVTVMGSVNGADWGPWQTYVQGTYRQFLGGG